MGNFLNIRNGRDLVGYGRARLLLLKGTIMLLEEWSVTGKPLGPYEPPEMAHQQLSGVVSGHPLHDDGKRVRTSDIKSVNGREVVTRSGSVYTLGEPHVEYVHWCRENGCHVPTEEEPIKLL